MLTTGSIRGDFPSLKLGRMVRYTSTIERDLLYFLEYRQTVTWYKEQPMRIEWRDMEGINHHYTPDYEIHESETKYLVECKPVAKLQSVHAQQQREIGTAWCAEHQYHFVTYTEADLRSGHVLENLKLLWRYARMKKFAVECQHLLEVVNTKPGMTVGELSQALALPLAEVVAEVCYLLFHHRLYMDMNIPFTVTSSLWLKEATHDAH